MEGLRALATDGVVVLEGEVVLLRRDHPPHEGEWVLPGGMVERGETAREACVREVEEEVDLEVVIEDFVGLFDAPDRDERGNVSVAYRCRPIDNGVPAPRDEAREVDSFPPGELPEMGFDHAAIVAAAFEEQIHA
ncbi:MAG: NUDIX domain-containing protein [Halodesulfurarchaeum sp.]